MMTKDQQAAVNHMSAHSCVVAVPGSGKTRVLISKAVAMIKKGYRNILIISFTNEATDEIRHRLSGELEKENLKFVEVATIHSIMLNHIKAHVGLGLLPPQQDTTIQLSILKMVGLETKHLEIFKKTIEANVPCADETLEKARQEYIQKVLQTKQVTLSNVVSQGVKWMEEGKLKPLPYCFLMIDEFQDVDLAQLKLVLLHGLSGVVITAVGDDDQSVYKFRSAKGYKAFTEVERVLGAKRFVLSDNFRSHREILDVANSLILQNKHRILKTIRSAKGAGGNVSYQQYENPDVEAEKVALMISQTPSVPTLVLARNTKYLERVDLWLTERQVAFQNISSAKSFETISAQIALNGLMAIATNDREKYNAFLYVLLDTQTEVDQVKSSLLMRTSPDGMPPQVKTIYFNLFNAKKMFLSGRFDDGFVLYFNMLYTQLDKLGYKQLSQLYSMQTYLKRCKGNTLKQRYNQLINSKQKKQDAPIKLMTMHTSKGLESERVFVLGVSKKIIPSEKSMQECGKDNTLIQSVISEERRLLFVALTRAMSDLHISSVQGTASQKNRHGVSLLLNEVVIDALAKQ